jgi:hypothetical protein
VGIIGILYSIIYLIYDYMIFYFLFLFFEFVFCCVPANDVLFFFVTEARILAHLSVLFSRLGLETSLI